MSRFSILIPSWNNLEHLQLCISSIEKNSHFKNQIIVYVNEGNDGTLDWVKSQTALEFLYSETNVGVCIALNSCRFLVKNDYVVYMNDDMYVCPDWDLELQKEIEKIGHNKFMLSSTLIEPRLANNMNNCSIHKNFGESINTFREEELLKSYHLLHKANWLGSSWPPSVVSTTLWDIVGGYSIEFSPGMYSDPDFSMKLWKYGVRIFRGIGSSKVYHFQSKSTSRLKKNSGSATFLMKWGITARTFYSHYLLMGRHSSELFIEPSLPSYISQLRNKIKRMFTGFLS